MSSKTVFDKMHEKETPQLGEYIKELLEYSDGDLRWRIRYPENRQNKRANKMWGGKSAGYIDKSGYKRVSVTFQGKRYSLLAHRIVWLICTGNWPERVIDHKDRNRMSNGIENLRDVPNIVNNKSRSKSKNNTSGTQGVQFNRKYHPGSDTKYTDYWVARWPDEKGKQRVKHFRIVGDGSDAYEKACAYRKDRISELGYSPTHGE